MNNVVSAAIGAAFGFVIGGSISYFYLNHKYDIVFEKETEAYREDIDSLKKKIDSLETIKKLEEKKASIVSDVTDAVVVNPDYMKLNSLIIDGDEEEEEEDEDDYVDVEESTFNSIPSDIRFIGPRDYEEDDEYKKEEFRYFSSDNVITQDDEVLDIEEFENVCGTSALKSFGMYGADRNYVYVRNEHFKTDYKIKKWNMSYQKYINNRMT